MIRNQTIKKSENEIKKIKEQRLVEESDNKLSESLFSNNPYIIDKSTNINIVKIGKNKFVSVMKPVKNEKNIKPIKNKMYDLNGFILDDYEDNYDYGNY